MVELIIWCFCHKRFGFMTKDLLTQAYVERKVIAIFIANFLCFLCHVIEIVSLKLAQWLIIDFLMLSANHENNFFTFTPVPRRLHSSSLSSVKEWEMKSLLSIILVSLVGQSICQNAGFIVSIAQVQDNVPSFRCVGTAISFRHVLTTASCADVPRVVVQIRNLTIGGTIGGSVDTCKHKSIWTWRWPLTANSMLWLIINIRSSRSFASLSSFRLGARS